MASLAEVNFIFVNQETLLMGMHALYRNNNLKKFISRSLMPKGDLLENTLVLRVEIPPIQTLHYKSLRHQTRRQWKVRGLKEWMTEAPVF